jgi:hypothetical protein
VPKKSEKTFLPSAVRKSDRLKNRVGRKTSTPDLVQVNNDQFVQVPLTFHEGRDFLSVIGCRSIQIPANIADQAQQQQAHVQL